MSFDTPTPEPKPWNHMTDPERLAYFRQCSDNQPEDWSAFKEALAQRRGVVHEPMGERNLIKATGAGGWQEGGGGSGSHITHGTPIRQRAP